MTFIGVLWLAGTSLFGWLPRTGTDHWTVATAFATAAAGAVCAAGAAWIGRSPGGQPSAAVGIVLQNARAHGRGQVAQVGGDQRVPSQEEAPTPPRYVRQDASASDSGSIIQIGGDVHLPPGQSD
ncbi:hypothetical protein AB0H92_32140 [Streptomyces phaeochromogenes]|uniref:hypothetical protein n=1 Tax=Streptomyces phaeochromogenes TaxID=1923 RepID=UPI0033E08C43